MGKDKLRVRAKSVPRKASLVWLALIAGCSSPEEQAAEALAGYDVAFAAGDYARALGFARQALVIRDDSAEYWLRLARAQVALEEFASAHDSFQRAYELDKMNIEAIQNLSQLSFMIGRYDEAVEHANRLLRSDPRNVAAMLSLGFVALEREQFTEALSHAEKALVLSPLNEDALVLKARALSAKNGSGLAAAVILEQAIRVKGVNEGMLRALADIYREDRNRASLRRTYARMIQLDPGDLRLKIDYLRELYEAGEAASALKIIESQQRARPNDLRFFENIVDVWREVPVEVPIEHVRRLAKFATPAAKVVFARYLADRGSAADVEHLMRPFIASHITPASADGAALYASAQLRLGKIKAAEALVRKVLEFDPSHALALRLQADIALGAGRLDQALLASQVLLRDQPNEPEHRILLANIYRKREQRQLAEMTYRTALKDFPANHRIFSQYADFLRSIGRLQAALALADEFTSANARSPDAWRARAELCLAARQPRCAADAAAALRALSQTP